MMTGEIMYCLTVSNVFDIILVFDRIPKDFEINEILKRAVKVDNTFGTGTTTTEALCAMEQEFEDKDVYIYGGEV